MDLSSRINYRFSVLRKTKIRSKETEKMVFLIGNDRTVSQRHKTKRRRLSRADSTNDKNVALVVLCAFSRCKRMQHI